MYSFVVSGVLTCIFFLPLYLMRVPKEEAMMLQQSGPEYRAYLERAGALWPRSGR